MALSPQEQNLISRTIDKARIALELRSAIMEDRAVWDLNGIFDALENRDTEIQAIFKHLTRAEIANAIGALDTITTALGDFVTGQATNLVKVKE